MNSIDQTKRSARPRVRLACAALGAVGLALPLYALNIQTDARAVCYQRDGRTFVRYLESGSIKVTGSGNVDVFVVGGGGGGGACNTNNTLQGGGGGGGGGVVARRNVAVTAGDYVVTVGAGGAVGVFGSSPYAGSNGGDSSVFGVIAHGGGGGADIENRPGANGASGGGSTSRSPYNTKVSPGGSGIEGEGYAGGTAEHIYGAAGGGGAGGEGGNYGSSGEAYPGAGGIGVNCAWLNDGQYYGGGGAGYSGGKTASGGLGGGGACTKSGPEPGTDGLGGGGCGGAKGGSGVVVIAYTPDEIMPRSEAFRIAGGHERIQVGDDDVHVFRTNGTLTVTGDGMVDVLVVGGGGGGGQLVDTTNRGIAGGGAGGVVYVTNFILSAGTYDVTVGAGGEPRSNGSFSSAFGLKAFGGGYGANGIWGNGENGGDGASGGGSTVKIGMGGATTTNEPGAAIYAAYGNLGFPGGRSVLVYGSGGGGGAGAPGQDHAEESEVKPGAGGDGVAIDIVGTNVWYAGGGGGSSSIGQLAAGGKGGGGAGETAGTDGTGGGGGALARGGDGIVIVRAHCAYPDVLKTTATGGTMKIAHGSYRVHTFTADGTFDMPQDAHVEVLLVGGGGGGGANNTLQSLQGGAGGGAGGFLHLTNFVIAAGTHVVKVGAGGGVSTNGENSAAFGLTAFGGGAGASWSEQKVHTRGADGGSGGGGTTSIGSDDGEGGTGVVGQGCDGGCAKHIYGASGGGGAGARGKDYDASDFTYPGAGGDGLPCSITGTEVWYAGGGAGFRQGFTASGGLGGGGACTKSGPETGTDGLGGGGCGGAKGGSGVVIIRYRIEPKGMLFVIR